MGWVCCFEMLCDFIPPLPDSFASLKKAKPYKIYYPVIHPSSVERITQPMQAQPKLTHQQAVQQLQASMENNTTVSHLDTSNVANIPPLAPTPMSELPLSQPIPPELENIDAEEEGYCVDEQELLLAQSRVKRWLELDAEISTLSTAIRERRRQKEDLNKHIIAFMQGNHVPHFDMSKGKLDLQVSKHKQPLSQKWVATQIQSVNGITQDKQDELMKVIFEDRAVTEKPRLKHVKGKK